MSDANEDGAEHLCVTTDDGAERLCVTTDDGAERLCVTTDDGAASEAPGDGYKHYNLVRGYSCPVPTTQDTGSVIPSREDANTSRVPRQSNYGTMSTADPSSTGDPLSHPPPRVQVGSLPATSGTELPSTSGAGQHVPSGEEYEYLPGMNVEITQSDNDMDTPNLPEGLRHVMLHIIGSRPSEEVKFRRLRYRLESTDGPGPQDSTLLPRGRSAQRPAHSNIRRQQSRHRGLVSRQVSQNPPDAPQPANQLTRQQSCDLVTSSAPERGGEGAEVVLVGGTSLRSATHGQKGVLVVLAINDLMTSMALSILAPFFPKEARKKGISEATSGWVFGVFALVQCLTSPLFGKILPRVGAKFLSQAGQFFAGGCTILFGMLQYVSTDGGSLTFLAFCFLLRMTMAVGCAASGTAAFAIAARTFPDNPATIFGLLETAVGFGLMMGPAIGGVLYEVGGFVAPFVVIGGAMLLSVPVGLWVLPTDPVYNSESGDVDSTICDFLRIPAITVTSLAAFIACMAWVMPDPTLEPHLSQFNLSPTVIGMVFLLMAACYAICSPVWGWVADNVEDSSPMMVVGFVGTGVGFMILGPTPLFQLPADFRPLWLNIIGLIVIGLMVSLALVPTYDKILDAAEKAGIDDTLANCSTLAGIWNSAYCFGEFVGPVLAGWMMTKVGFGWTMTLAAGSCFLMALIMLVLCVYERHFGTSNANTAISNSSISEITERTSLLNPVDVFS